ncbi:MAG: hypothetical protein H0V66_08145 [Bdellovibrionales bacterium]|nr:hypothetical protein [Bdellovibrionales bacterium]
MWILLLLFSALSWGFPVLHFIKPESNFTQIVTLDACATFLITKDMVGCNPALFPYQKEEGLRMGLATITDGESVEVGQKLLFDPIKEEFLREIFEEHPFSSWGGNSFIQLRTSKFYLSYDPILVNADVFVFNPASPEVAMSLVKSNRLNVTSGLEVLNNDVLKMSLGLKAYYYRSEYYQDSFFLSQLSSQDVDELIDFEKDNGVAGDLASFFQFENQWLPKISLIIKNINTTFRNKESDILSESQMRPLLVYEMYSRASLGYDYKTTWGIFNAELSSPFSEVFQDIYTEYIVGSLNYSLSRFSTSLSYSKYQQAFGFNFGSKIASIGIFYGNSQPLGDFSQQKEKMAGVRGEVSL